MLVFVADEPLPAALVTAAVAVESEADVAPVVVAAPSSVVEREAPVAVDAPSPVEELSGAVAVLVDDCWSSAWEVVVSASALCIPSRGTRAASMTNEPHAITVAREVSLNSRISTDATEDSPTRMGRSKQTTCDSSLGAGGAGRVKQVYSFSGASHIIWHARPGNIHGK